LAQLYVRVGILLTCRTHLYERIISVRGETWAHKTRLTPILFIEGSVPCQKNECWCICALGVSILHLLLRFFYWLL